MIGKVDFFRLIDEFIDVDILEIHLVEKNYCLSKNSKKDAFIDDVKS